MPKDKPTPPVQNPPAPSAVQLLCRNCGWTGTFAQVGRFSGDVGWCPSCSRTTYLVDGSPALVKTN